MENLYIIGNGFDLFHGIPSSFSLFGEFLESQNKTLYDDVVEFFLFEEWNGKEYKADWNRLESAQADLDYYTIIERAEEFLVSYGTEKWSDAFHHDYQFEIGQITERLSKELKKEFTTWILRLPIPHRESQKQPLLNFLENSCFLTFNYTSTLESLYNVPLDQIVYIHGKAIDEQSDLILGHCWKEHEIHSLSEKYADEDQDTRVAEGYSIIDGYFRETYKHSETIIENHKSFFDRLTDLKTVFVLGHSLSEVDIQYFEEIASKINIADVNWIVSFYSDEERERHFNTLTSIGVPKERICLKRLEDI